MPVARAGLQRTWASSSGSTTSVVLTLATRSKILSPSISCSRHKSAQQVRSQPSCDQRQHKDRVTLLLGVRRPCASHAVRKKAANSSELDRQIGLRRLYAARYFYRRYPCIRWYPNVTEGKRTVSDKCTLSTCASLPGITACVCLACHLSDIPQALLQRPH